MEDDETLQILVRFEFQEHHQYGIARVNNGSFGSCPASVQAVQAQWASLWLHQPDSFYFGPLQEAILASRKAVASIIHAPSVEQVLLLDNVTVAVSMVLQKIAWAFCERKYQKGDMVLAMNFTYGAVKNALKAYLLRAGAHLLEVSLPFPVSSSAEIVAAFEFTLNQAQAEGRRIRFALIDHIVSMPTMILPIHEIVSLCRQAGIDEIFVDGAHGIGSIDINVQEIDADYYTSNLHKWLFAPPAVAVLYCKSEHLTDLHHPIVSHGYGKGLSKECEWVGTRDYSAQLAAADAIKFFKKFKGGLKAVQDYNHDRVVSMGEMLAKAWGTHCGTPPDLCASMIMVGLPNARNIHSNDDADNFRTRIRQDFGVEVHVYYAGDAFPTRLLEMSDTCTESSPFLAYVRLSHQIYNTLEDYVKLREAVKC